jgi:hypothetical protein
MGKQFFLNGKTFLENIFAFKWPNTWVFKKKYIVFSAYEVLYMSNNFPTFSRIYVNILSIFWCTSCLVWSLLRLMQFIFVFWLSLYRQRFSNVLGRIFRIKIVSLTRAGNCISQRAVAFQSGPDAKNRPTLKGSSANQIASFWLIKNKHLYQHEWKVGKRKIWAEWFHTISSFPNFHECWFN